MQTYVVTRPGIADGAAALDAALTRLRSFEAEPHALPAQWMHSYALRQADGRFGLSCVLQADSVQTLQRHAEQTGVAAREILPVAATRVLRPFAPTRVYLIRRRAFWNTLADLDRSAALARRIGDEEMPRQVSWLHSYAVHEADGTLGSVCLYQAVDPEALREHAARVGMPADEITPVIGRIVFRVDTATQASPHGAISA